MPLTIIYTDSQGREWRYVQGTSRVRCYQPPALSPCDEINVWDHARGKADFDWSESNGLRDRVLRYLRESEAEAEASHEAVPPAGTRSRDGRYQADGLGCVERVSSVERDWDNPAAHSPRGY